MHSTGPKSTLKRLPVPCAHHAKPRGTALTLPAVPWQLPPSFLAWDLPCYTQDWHLYYRYYHYCFILLAPLEQLYPLVMKAAVWPHRQSVPAPQRLHCSHFFGECKHFFFTLSNRLSLSFKAKGNSTVLGCQRIAVFTVTKTLPLTTKSYFIFQNCSQPVRISTCSLWIVINLLDCKTKDWQKWFLYKVLPLLLFEVTENRAAKATALH